MAGFDHVISQLSGASTINLGTVAILKLDSGMSSYSGVTRITGGALALTGMSSTDNSFSGQISNGATLDISGIISGTTIADLFSFGTGNVTLGGKMPLFTATYGNIGLVGFVGAAGADKLNLTVADGETCHFLGKAAFEDWFAGIDKITLNGNVLGNEIIGTSPADTLDSGLGDGILYGFGSPARLFTYLMADAG